MLSVGVWERAVGIIIKKKTWLKSENILSFTVEVWEWVEVWELSSEAAQLCCIGAVIAHVLHKLLNYASYFPLDLTLLIMMLFSQLAQAQNEKSNKTCWVSSCRRGAAGLFHVFNQCHTDSESSIQCSVDYHLKSVCVSLALNMSLDQCFHVCFYMWIHDIKQRIKGHIPGERQRRSQRSWTFHR